ncbi:MAG: glycosyltransferase family 2 protein, partial [Candidatus Adiutrix sp.]
LGSVAKADEIIVIDDLSTDNTVELAKQAGAKILRRKLDSFAAQRNAALKEVHEGWVFFLDADERVSPQLMASVCAHINLRPGCAAYATRRTWAFGRRHWVGPLKPDKVLRLFPVGEVYWQGQIHERPVCSLPTCGLKGELTHFTYENFEHYLEKQSRYATLWAEEKAAKGEKSSPPKAIIKTAFALLKMFILNGGLVGGPLVWALCYYHGAYTLTKYLKLYEASHSPKAD